MELLVQSHLKIWLVLIIVFWLLALILNVIVSTVGTRSIWALEVSNAFLWENRNLPKLNNKLTYQLDFHADFFCSTYQWLVFPNLIWDFSVYGKWSVLNDAELFERLSLRVEKADFGIFLQPNESS